MYEYGEEAVGSGVGGESVSLDSTSPRADESLSEMQTTWHPKHLSPPRRYVPHPICPYSRTNLLKDPPRKEEYRPAPGSDTTSLSSTPPKTNDVGDLDASEMLNEDEDDEDEFTYAEDLVRYIRNGEGGDWFCIGVAGTSNLSPIPACGNFD